MKNRKQKGKAVGSETTQEQLAAWIIVCSGTSQLQAVPVRRAELNIRYDKGDL